MKQWLLHPIRELRKRHYIRIIRKAAWILDQGLINMHIPRAERRRVAMQARLVNVALANEKRKARSARVEEKELSGARFQTIETARG
jgi:hypothetical protein